MVNYLILCRSLTYAQRSAAALERAGLPARILRCPKGLSTEGCSHCVRVTAQAIERALETLRYAGLTPKHVFVSNEAGGFEEVELA